MPTTAGLPINAHSCGMSEVSGDNARRRNPIEQKRNKKYRAPPALPLHRGDRRRGLGAENPTATDGTRGGRGSCFTWARARSYPSPAIMETIAEAPTRARGATPRPSGARPGIPRPAEPLPPPPPPPHPGTRRASPSSPRLHPAPFRAPAGITPPRSGARYT